MAALPVTLHPIIHTDQSFSGILATIIDGSIVTNFRQCRFQVYKNIAVIVLEIREPDQIVLHPYTTRLR